MAPENIKLEDALIKTDPKTVELLQRAHRWQQSRIAELERERDALKAEVERLDAQRLLQMKQTNTVLADLQAHVRTLRESLTHLLDDWERSHAGFPQHIEVRYACRDGARAALAATEVSE